MQTADILTDTTNSMNPYSSNGIKGIWDSRLRSYRGASMDGTSSMGNTNNGSSLQITPKRSSSSSNALLGRSSTGRTSSTRDGGRTSSGGLTDSDGRRSLLRPSSATPSGASPMHSASAAAAPRGRSATVSPLKRHSSASALTATPSSPSPRRQRSTSSLAKPLFHDKFLLMPLDSHEVTPALTVVLDLDETLVSNRSAHLTRAILRPYCLHVLHALRHMRNLEIVLWTASTKETAAPVVDQLHALGPIFDDMIFRNNLWFTDPIHTKDLRQLGRNMDRVVIVDNAANCCKLNPMNALLIDDFRGCRHEEDAALVNVYYVVEALLKLANAGVPVSEGLAQLAEEGNLCHPVDVVMPKVWRSLPLSEIAPLKIPPHGTFFRSNTPAPCRSIMKYWKY